MKCVYCKRAHDQWTECDDEVPHPCKQRCQYAQDVGMPEHRCGNGCMYDKHEQVPPNAQQWDQWKPARDVS